MNDVMAAKARLLAEAGFWVFPLAAGKKVPQFKADWAKLATRDPHRINDLWGGQNYNIGIMTEKFGADKALIVIDVDVKGGRNGGESLKKWLEGRALPETMVQSTPSGGHHYIFVVDKAVKQGTDILGPGVDIRSRGGYIVGPGSETPEGKYRWL